MKKFSVIDAESWQFFIRDYQLSMKLKEIFLENVSRSSMFT